MFASITEKFKEVEQAQSDFKMTLGKRNRSYIAVGAIVATAGAIALTQTESQMDKAQQILAELNQ